ncbi:putative GTP-binding protein, partial [Toxoplasma gondii FOU]
EGLRCRRRRYHFLQVQCDEQRQEV